MDVDGDGQEELVVIMTDRVGAFFFHLSRMDGTLMKLVVNGLTPYFLVV